MNIIEAIKSGRRFRRKSWTSRDWLTTEREKHVNEYRLDLPIEALIADDWEVEQIEIKITYNVFIEAYEESLKRIVWSEKDAPLLHDFGVCLLEKLGLL